MLDGAKLGSTLVLYAATVVGFEGDDLDHRGPRRALVQGQRELRDPGPRRRAREARRGGAHRVERGAQARGGHQADQGQDRRALHRSRRPLRRGAPPGRQADRDDGQAPAGPLRQADRGPRARQLRGAPPTAKSGCTCSWSRPPPTARPSAGSPSASAARRSSPTRRISRPIPIRFTPKIGAVVWAEWVGTLRGRRSRPRGDPGLFTVKFERAGRPATVGFGRILPPIEPWIVPIARARSLRKKLRIVPAAG